MPSPSSSRVTTRSVRRDRCALPLRRLGVGAQLLAAAERAALDAGRTLLVLDTVTGTDAERLYVANGWTRVGEIPNYALWPDGRTCPTTVYYKELTVSSASR